MKYSQAIEGEWFDLDPENNRIACCDCGLVHSEDYRVVGGVIQCRSRRDKRKTAAIRRERKKRERHEGQ